MEYNKDQCIYEIISLYNSNLPFVVAEYFCKLFHPKILCRIPVKYNTIFEPFIDYRKGITYYFQTIKSDSNEYNFVRLVSITILIKGNQEEEFMYKYSNYVDASSSGSSIEWFDSDEIPDGYVGKCTISF
jgi:hypothetical protein